MEEEENRARMEEKDRGRMKEKDMEYGRGRE